MNAEQASKRMMRRQTRRHYGEGYQRPGMPRHLANERSTGRLRRGDGDCMCAQEDGCNAGSPVSDAHTPTGNLRGPAGVGRVAETPVVPGKPGYAGGGKGPLFESNAGKGARTMETGASLATADTVRKLQSALHAKAKRDSAFRFYTLSDRVWQQDMLEAAWQAVRRNREAFGVDGETVAAVEELGVDRRLGLTGARGQLPAVRCAAGADPEEAAGAILPLGHTVPARSGGADGGDAGAIADFRSGPATRAVCLPSRAQRTGRSSARASAGEQRA